MLYGLKIDDCLIKELKEKYPKGTRVKLNHMGYDPDPIEDGTCGTVFGVDDVGSIHVDWDNGRRLALISGIDGFEIIS